MYRYTYLYIYLSISISTYIYPYIFIYVCVCVCVFCKPLLLKYQKKNYQKDVFIKLIIFTFAQKTSLD